MENEDLADMSISFSCFVLFCFVDFVGVGVVGAQAVLARWSGVE